MPPTKKWKEAPKSLKKTRRAKQKRILEASSTQHEASVGENVEVDDSKMEVDGSLAVEYG